MNSNPKNANPNSKSYSASKINSIPIKDSVNNSQIKINNVNQSINEYHMKSPEKNKILNKNTRCSPLIINKNDILKNYIPKDNNLNTNFKLASNKKIKKLFRDQGDKNLYDKTVNIIDLMDEKYNSMKYNSVSSCSNLNNKMFIFDQKGFNNNKNNIVIISNDSYVNNNTNNNPLLSRNISNPNLKIHNLRLKKNSSSIPQKSDFINNNPNNSIITKNINEPYFPNINHQINNNSYNLINRKRITVLLKNNVYLSNKENACFILTKSPILNLRERLILSRCSSNVKGLAQIKDLLNQNEQILKEKKIEYNQKLAKYEKEIKKSVFMASKIADISFNFIREKDEEELFENYKKLAQNGNLDFVHYENFIKVIYCLVSEKQVNDEEINRKLIMTNLYEKIKQKGFNNIKDYLYNSFILQKKSRENLLVNLDKINLILSKEPKIFDHKALTVTCRFFSFSVYLIQEIVTYANLINGIYDLIKNTKNAIDVITYKINIYQKNCSN